MTAAVVTCRVDPYFGAQQGVTIFLWAAASIIVIAAVVTAAAALTVPAAAGDAMGGS